MTHREALWESGHDESVEVNQRALIDKVLARYSGEFTVFRELLQNSSDSGSKRVEIHFKTKSYLDRKTDEADANTQGSEENWRLPDLKTTLIHQWTFKNDGMLFRDEDWSRLKKIAEGNPDEEKIGAFGVGFYSLFSVTEEPFVTSGSQWMGFYWKDKKDQLYARRGTIPEASEPDPWTSFTMPLREPVPMPTPFDFVRFLTSSITFVAHLTQVSVLLDGKLLAKIRRERGVPRTLNMKPTLKPDSSKRTMRVAGVEVTPLHIKAEVMRCVYVSGSSKPKRNSITKANTIQTTTTVASGFFSSLFSSFAATPARTPKPLPPADQAALEAEKKAKDAEEEKKLTQMADRSVVLTVFSADVNVSLDEKIRKELLRATKKTPPSRTRLELIFTGKDEYEASKREDEQEPEATGSIFQGLRADIEGNGTARIFIGHTTGQTTGLGGHMSGRFIPTVERESIDLVDRNVRVWNEELLDMGGYLARTAYEVEMDNINNLWTNSTEGDTETRTWLRARALHALKFFTFYASTPAPQVSTLLEEAFFACGIAKGFAFLGASTPPPFPMISTAGVCNAYDIRMPNEAFSFLKQLPVIPEEVLEEARKIVGTLKDRGMIPDINFSDVTKELAARPLLEEELVACLKWWIGVYTEGSTSATQIQRVRTELINTAILVTGKLGSPEEKTIPLHSINTFLNTRGTGALIPTDGPLPDHLLPVSVSQRFNPVSLGSAMAWRELTILEWLQHLLDEKVTAVNPEYDPTSSAPFAERLLNILARAWPSSPKTLIDGIVAVLRQKACIPTSMGLQRPEEAYFQTAHVFSDLPIVTLPSGAPVRGMLEKVLQALGVRKHVDLQIVFNRMIKTGDWSTSELVKYLVAVQSTLSWEELERLRLTAAFPMEAGAATDKGKIPRGKASELYEPVDSLRELGLPILDWGTKTKWRPNSDEAKFLYNLGLLRYPPLDVLLGLAASSDSKVRAVALRYFLDNASTKYGDYSPTKYSHVAFVPAMKDGQRFMAKPTEVFTSIMWSSLGFAVADPNLHRDDLAKLQINEHPPTSMLVKLLQNTPPVDEKTAQLWFEAMAGRVSDFSSAELRTLSETSFVPLATAPAGEKSGSSTRLLPPNQCYFKGQSNAQVHSKLFVFVDFGPGNIFLSQCGTKHEPSVEEIAKILVDDPRRFYQLADGRDNYLIELRNIAVNRRLISTGILTRMKRNPILLGSRRVKKIKKDSKDTFVDLDDEDNWDFEYDLMRPNQIVIADDTNAYQHFGDVLFAAPQEDFLEDFYIELGSPRLSSLVREKFRTGTEIRGSKKAQEIRSLILERLPLFLHEHSHAKTKVPYTWLNNEQNFVVRTFGKIAVVKTLNFGQISASKSQDASAVAMQEGRGAIQLWLSGNDLIDMYEVSTSICRLLFDSPKASDALLFMTILSTDLRALRRRGYNVDRILRKQKAERQAAEDAVRERERQMALVSPSNESAVGVASQPTTHGQLAADSSVALPVPEKGPIPSTASSADLHIDRPAPRPPSVFHNSLSHLKRKLTGQRDGHQGMPSTSDARPGSPSNLRDDASGMLLGSPSPTPQPGSRTRTPQPGVTPWSAISANIDMAVKACREENNQVLHNRSQMQMVKEATNEGYCDISGRAGSLTLLGEMGGMKVFAAQDVQNASSVMTTKHDALARFIHVTRSLIGVYGLPPTSVHIFVDTAGEVIAFNRNASLFLNLRFFETWHDAEVRNGDLSKAYISWYFTLAHEIAHNLVQPHNSEHEFYFSSICEHYLPSFSRLLASVPQ
ncbi:unnamed protein product [Somion occarium]|uniref:Sacsin/Nov domain-containing protein n=1 Tax=Somion occarium TaxID=3059160 RepID=A0ABP1DQV4_9APHY